MKHQCTINCQPHIPRMEWAIMLLLPSHRASPHFGHRSFPVQLEIRR